MSDPFRDHMAQKRSKKKEKVRDEYTPLVVWVKVPDGKRVQELLSYVEDTVDSIPFVDVATKHRPYWFASDGTNREENADGNQDNE